MRAPLPYPGGKNLIASAVWERFGDCGRYVEPFAGSAAVLLARPHDGRHELILDKDCFVVNFWRSVQADPMAVAKAMDRPQSQKDLTAIRKWLEKGRDALNTNLEDIDFCDPLVAGRWCWVRCVIIGAGLAETKQGKSDIRPASLGTGIAAKGIRSQEDPLAAIHQVVASLAHRMRDVVVMHGEWSRAVTEASLFQGLGPKDKVAVLLDPPYNPATQVAKRKTYVEQRDGLAEEAMAWAIAHGDDPRLRIALCGYEGAYSMPDAWTKVSWESRGYAFSEKQGEQRKMERVWFSPHCLDPSKLTPLQAYLAQLG